MITDAMNRYARNEGAAALVAGATTLSSLFAEFAHSPTRTPTYHFDSVS
jgi:hypothetical protein